MSGYLTTLAARALGHPQPIRPRLLSLFEPPPGFLIRPVQTSRRRTRAQKIKSTSADHREGTASHKVDAPVIVMTKAATEPSYIVPSRRIKSTKEKDQVSDSKPDRSPTTKLEISANPPAPKLRIESVATVEIPPRPVGTTEPATQIRTDVRSHKQPATVVRTRETHTRKTVPSERTVFVERSYEAPAERDEDVEPIPILTEFDRSTSVKAIPAVINKPIDSTEVGTTNFVDATPSSIRITIGRVDVRAIMPAGTQTPTVPLPQPAVKALSLDEYLKNRNGVSS